MAGAGSQGAVAAPIRSSSGESWPARRPGPRSGTTTPDRRLFVVSVIVAIVPIAVATARAVGREWLPIGDNAFFAIRARDVFGHQVPLLGTWTSASLESGISFNNPGPLLFDLLALPTTFAGDAGVAIGTALLNAAFVVGIAVFAHRRGGPLLGTAAMAAAATLCWAMGSELLFDPWQPHSLLLAFLCFLMLVWSVGCGDLVALPFAAGVGSLILQTHLSYAFLVPLVALWALLALVLELRRRKATDPVFWPSLRRRATRSVAAAGVVFALGWAQPLVEQFTGDGEGNLTRLTSGVDDRADTVGYGLGAQLVAEVVSLPPFWLRPSFADAYLPSQSVPSAGFVPTEGARVPGLALAVVSLVVLGAVLGACVWDGRRRADRTTWMAAATAVVALAAGLLTAGRLPVGVLGIAPHQFRWLWPLGVFAVFVVVTTLARRFVSSGGPAPRVRLIGVFLLVTAVVATLNLPTSNPRVGPSADAFAITPARELGEQLGALEDEGTLLFDVSELVVFDPYTVAVMAELQRRDIPFVVDDPVMVRQLGSDRRFTGGNADAVLVLAVGDATRTTPDGARRVALREELTPDEQDELAERQDHIAEYVRREGLPPLTDEGRETVEEEHFPLLRAQLAGEEPVDPAPLIASRELAALARVGLLDLSEPWSGRFERYAELQRRFDNETVALFLRPL